MILHTGLGRACEYHGFGCDSVRIPLNWYFAGLGMFGDVWGFEPLVLVGRWEPPAQASKTSA